MILQKVYFEIIITYNLWKCLYFLDRYLLLILIFDLKTICTLKYLRVNVHLRDSESFVGKEFGEELVKAHNFSEKEMTQTGQVTCPNTW